MKLSVFGKELKKKRVDHDMSLKDLSNITNLSTGYLSAIERGTRNVTAPTFNIICDAMDIEDGEKELFKEWALMSNSYQEESRRI